MDRAREGNRDVNDCSYRTHTHTYTHIKRGKKVLSPFIFGVVSFLP